MPDSFHLKGKNFPDPADPVDRVCFLIEIPDAIEYRAALMGQIEWLADWRCWRHSNIDYTDPPAVNLEIAGLFAQAISLSKFEACMTACEEVAQCLIDGDETLINALADAIANNPILQAAVAAAVTAAGGGVAGEPLTPEQAAEDINPENVKDDFGDCIPDALWGGMLYLVQSGNRVITDFFEVLEVATNTLENMEIVSRAIPAAGDYIATAAAFADQLAETLQESYAGAYTESYEQSLACDLFCAARSGCELTPDMIMGIINARLTSPIDIGDFGEIMLGVATGTWIGDEIADVMFLVYFGALVFGQQFLEQIGIRPLTVIISLGADQLASDNWIALCDCPEDWESIIDFEIEDYGFTAPNLGTYTPSVGWEDTYFAVGGGYRGMGLTLALSSAADVVTAEYQFEYTAGTLVSSGDKTAYLGNELAAYMIDVITPVEPVSPLLSADETVFNTINAGLVCGIGGGGSPSDPGGTCILKVIKLRGRGTKPAELP